MNKNTITGLILMFLVVLGFSWYNQRNAALAPPPEAAQPTAAAKASTKPLQAATAHATTPTDSTAIFATAASDSATAPIVLKNQHLIVSINPMGGQISEVRMTGYKSYADYKAGADEQLLLYSAKDATLNFLFETKQENISTAALRFQAEHVTERSADLVLRGKNGAVITYHYALGEDYMLNQSVKVEGMAQQFSPRQAQFGIAWEERVPQYEKGFYFENMYSTLSYKLTNNENEKLSEQASEEEKAEGDVHWVAFKNQYFSRVFIAKEGFKQAEFASQQLEEQSGYLKNYNATMAASFDPQGQQATELQWYFGPNNYRLLQTMEQQKLGTNDLNLESLVYLGWPLIRWINRFFTIYVFDFLSSLNLPMWLVLLFITLLLRAIVFPPTFKTYMTGVKSRLLRPKMEELAAKYPKPEDNLKLTQERMRLSSLYGVSAMGGCLPMLIQMPIWIAMYNFLPNAIEFRQERFLWADDLSAYDDLISWSGEIWGVGNHISIFCLLFCVANVLFTIHNMRQQRDQMSLSSSPEQANMMNTMKYVMYFMPVMFFFMFNKYSAGLNFYYFLSLFSSSIITWVLRFTTNEEQVMAKMEATYAKNVAKPNSASAGGFMSRLAALQEQAEAAKREQEKRRGQ